MKRMTDERLKEILEFRDNGALEAPDEVLDGLVAERAEVQRLTARCTRQGGDPTVDMLARWAASDMVPLYVRDIARALLRAWGEEA